MPRLPKPAQYLLRIDDLCPTSDVQRWQRVRELIQTFRIQPMLAVIPDNLDAELHKSAPDPEFWQQMRQMQEAGATVALHGYHHVCREQSDCGLRPLHRSSEFAGVPFETQRSWIESGLEILRDHGLNPRLWVAPRHGFDWNTLRAIAELGIPFLSDGLARRPFLRGGVTWVPMQLWSPVARERGLWTICIHPNSTDDQRFAELEAFVEKYAEQFTSFDCVVRDFPAAELSVLERLYERVATRRILLRRALAQREISRHGD